MPLTSPINLSKLFYLFNFFFPFNRVKMGHLVLPFYPTKERMLCLYLVLLSSKVKGLFFSPSVLIVLC